MPGWYGVRTLSSQTDDNGDERALKDSWLHLEVGIPVWSVVFGEADGTHFVGGACADGKVRLWDVESGVSSLKVLSGHDGAVLALAIDHVRGRSVIASGGIDGTVRLWNPNADGGLDHTLRGHVGGVRAVAQGRLGNRNFLASAGADGTVRLWDPETGVPAHDPLEAHSGSALSVAFGSDGSSFVLASGGDDATIRLWDPETGVPLFAPLKGHGGSVRSLAFGPLGGRNILASASDDGTVRLWDLESGTALPGRLTGHIGTVRAVKFTEIAGLSVLVSAGIDGTIRLWDLEARTAYPDYIMAAPSDLRSVSFGTIAGETVIAASSGEGCSISRVQDQFDIGQLFAPNITRSHIVTADTVRTDDALGRIILARHLYGVIGQLVGPGDISDQRSTVLSIDGRWGSGKSTLAHLLVDEMQVYRPPIPDASAQEHGQNASASMIALPYNPIVINFDAWRESVIAPQWWALTAAINRGVSAERNLLARIGMTITGAARRIFRSSATLAAIGFVIIVVFGSMIIRRTKPGDINETLSSLETFVTGASFLFAAVAVATRSLFWASPVLGRLNLRADDNPLGQVADMVTSICKWSPRIDSTRRPILLLLDELDRCSASTVVAYLETVHTLLRSREPSNGRFNRPGPAALIVLVVADGRWVRTAFTTEYDDFKDLGSSVRSLGGDFLQKVFDHTVLVPDLTAEQIGTFLQEITRVKQQHGKEEVIPETPVPNSSTTATYGEEPESSRDNGSESRQLVQAADHAQAAVSPAAIRRREAHLLEAYAPILPSNPRLIRRVTNSWAMLEALISSLGHTEPDDLIVRAAILYISFPSLVDQLFDNPIAPNFTEPNSEWMRPDVLAILRQDDRTLYVPEDVARCYGRFFPSVGKVPTKES